MKKIIPALGFLFFANILLSQVGLQLEKKVNVDQEAIHLEFNQLNYIKFSNPKEKTIVPSDLKNFLLAKNVSANASSFLRKNNNTPTEAAFFCRIESEIEQSSKIPLRFRLGEVQAVDRKEGKWKQFEQ